MIARLAAPNTRSVTTTYDDVARHVRVSYFNQLGELYSESENADDAGAPIVAGSAHDIRTISMGARSGGSVVYLKTQ